MTRVTCLALAFLPILYGTGWGIGAVVGKADRVERLIIGYSLAVMPAPVVEWYTPPQHRAHEFDPPQYWKIGGRIYSGRELMGQRL